MTEAELNNNLLELFNHVDAKKLKEIQNKFNPFSVLGIESYEIRHSNTLAWLLDPCGSHGLSDKFLRLFLQNFNNATETTEKEKLQAALENKASLQSVQVRREITLKDIESRSESVVDAAVEGRLNGSADGMEKTQKNGLLDVLIQGDDWIVAIEVKVQARQGTGQLEKYSKALNHGYGEVIEKHLVYLTNNDEGLPGEWTAYKWDTLVITSLRQIKPDLSAVNPASPFILSFLEIVEAHSGVGNRADLIMNLCDKFGPALDQVIRRKKNLSDTTRVILTLNRVLINELARQFSPSNKKRAVMLRGLFVDQGYHLLEKDSSAVYIKFIPTSWHKITWLSLPDERKKSWGALIEIENQRDSGIQFKLIVRDRSKKDDHQSHRQNLVKRIYESELEQKEKLFLRPSSHALWYSEFIRVPDADSKVKVWEFFHRNVQHRIDAISKVLQLLEQEAASN